MLRRFLYMLWSFYGLLFPVILAEKLKKYKYNIGDFFAWFWTSKEFKRATKKLDATGQVLVAFYAVMLVFVIWAVCLLLAAGRWQLTVLLIILFPYVLVHLLAVPIALVKGALALSHPLKTYKKLKKSSR